MPRYCFHSACAVVLLALAVAACGESADEVGETEEGKLVLGQTEERSTAERGIAPGGRVLVFEGFHGDIRLDASNDKFATLEIVKIARGENSDAAQQLLRQLSVKEEGTDTEYYYRMTSPNEQRTAVNISGSVPEQANVRRSWRSGAIALSGPDGPLHITNGSGAVEVAGLAGNAEIRVNNGGILVGVERLPEDAEIVLETSNGDITVSLPVETSAKIAAETTAGSISTTALEFQDRQLEPVGAGSAFEGRLGRGNASIRIRTENGDINLVQGRMERLSPSDTLAAPSDTTAADTLDADRAVVDSLGQN